MQPESTRAGSPAYYAHHSWMARNYPKSGRCEWCGTSGYTEFAEMQAGKLSRNWADWLELCKRCHSVFDGNITKMVAARLAKVTNACLKCGNDDWYIRPNGRRQCKPCQRENVRRHRRAHAIAASTD